MRAGGIADITSFESLAAGSKPNHAVKSQLPRHIDPNPKMRVGQRVSSSLYNFKLFRPRCKAFVARRNRTAPAALLAAPLYLQSFGLVGTPVAAD